MGYRKIPEDKVLEFPATPGFKEWEPFFTEESTTHPAKMNLNLLRWILETYTEPREVVLDPMAGTGSTIILAALMGRHGVAVEYEPRFCDMIRANIKLTERQATLAPKGRMICIQGDARELSKLLKESDTIITSPPYSGSETETGGIKGKRGGDSKLRVKKNYSEVSEENIGRLPHGDIDAVITSPPYEGLVPAQDEGWLEEHWDDESKSPKHKTMRFGKSMRGYPKKVDTVVTSPPYSEGTGYGGGPASEKLTREKRTYLTGSKAYSKPLDIVVTSPPYEGSVDAKGDPVRRAERMKEAGLDPKTIVGGKARCGEIDWRYSDDSGNIGNLKSETYLQAMLQVYSECWEVLKPNGGKLIVVIKNFIRDKQVVRLDLDTVKLCEAAGFRLADHWYFKLPTRSFWRILYHKKHPQVPEVEYEDVLVFDKGDKG